MGPESGTSRVCTTRLARISAAPAIPRGSGLLGSCGAEFRRSPMHCQLRHGQTGAKWTDDRMDYGWTDRHHAACVPGSLLLYHGYTRDYALRPWIPLYCTVRTYRTLSMEILNDRCLALHPPLDRRQVFGLMSTSAAFIHTHDRIRGIENAEMILSRDYRDMMK